MLRTTTKLPSASAQRNVLRRTTALSGFELTLAYAVIYQDYRAALVELESLQSSDAIRDFTPTLQQIGASLAIVTNLLMRDGVAWRDLVILGDARNWRTLFPAHAKEAGL